MLNVIPKGWSSAFSVIDGTRPVAETANLSWWSDKSELRIQDEVYTARREGADYILESPAGVIARAERPGMFRRGLVVEYANRRYALRARSAWSREFGLFENDAQIGSIAPEGMFTRKAVVDLPKALAPTLQIFVIWLVMTTWKHEAAAASS